MSRMETNPPDPGVFDLKRALDRLEGSHEMLSELARIFLDESPRWMRELKEAVAANEAEPLSRAAHDIKGSSAVFAAASATRAAGELERMGRERDLAGAGGVVSELEVELASLRRALEDYLEEGGT